MIFLNNMLNHLIIIGAVGLTIIALLPIILSGIFNITRLSFMGTSLIIIVNVVLETAKSIESKMWLESTRVYSKTVHVFQQIRINSMLAWEFDESMEQGECP